MHDLTRGSIGGHILRLAAPIAAGMVFQTLYFLVDIFFVARLGDAAIAGVGAAANIQFIVMALTQVLGVGTLVLISHAAGRKDQAAATLVYNQSLLIALLAAIVTLVGGATLGRMYVQGIAATPEAFAAGMTYLWWFLPGLGLQFALVAMESALRGTGIVKPTMVVQVLTVGLNVVLTPILVAGWLTGRPMGVAGAGLATTISVAVGVVLRWLYFERLEKFVAFDRAMFRPRPAEWARLLRIGLPAGGEFALLFLYMGVIYFVVAPFGSGPQAGVVLGMRVMQAVFLPAMAIAFAAAPVAGQNVGAGLHARARETFRVAAGYSALAMACLTILCQLRAGWLVQGFSGDPEVLAVGTEFLRIISWNFVATGVIFTCSSLFQALGNTLPSVVSSATRIITFAVPILWRAQQPGFTLRHIWFLSVATVGVQLLVSLLLLKREFRLRLSTPMAEPAAASA
jgi:putative MATE family efflux protein